MVTGVEEFVEKLVIFIDTCKENLTIKKIESCILIAQFGD